MPNGKQTRKSNADHNGMAFPHLDICCMANTRCQKPNTKWQTNIGNQHNDLDCPTWTFATGVWRFRTLTSCCGFLDDDGDNNDDWINEENFWLKVMCSVSILLLCTEHLVWSTFDYDDDLIIIVMVMMMVMNDNHHQLQCSPVCTGHPVWSTRKGQSTFLLLLTVIVLFLHLFIIMVLNNQDADHQHGHHDPQHGDLHLHPPAGAAGAGGAGAAGAGAAAAEILIFFSISINI